ncbi:hypothetical protein X777_11194, partial [Ooceraea biroi]
LSSSRIHVNCQEPASLITTIDELERAHSTVRKSLSLSLSPFSRLVSCFLFHCLSSESGVVAQKYRELVDSRRVASRITVTYRARINPRRLFNLSLFSPPLCLCVCVYTPFPPFAHRYFFFLSSRARPFPSTLPADRSESMSRMYPDAYDITLLGSASERNEHDERTFREYGCGGRRDSSWSDGGKM